MRFLKTAMVCAGATLACGGGETRTPAAAPPATPAAEGGAPAGGAPGPDRLIYGVVTLAPEATFRACDGAPIVAILDSTSNRLRPAVGLSGSSEERGLYIIGVGATSPTRALIIREVRYAVMPASGEGCESPAPTYAMAVRGIDSGWTITVRPQAIEYRNASGGDVSQFRGADAGSLSISTSTESGVARTLEINLTAASCRDPKNGAWAPFRAAVTLDGKQLQGCAWRGT